MNLKKIKTDLKIIFTFLICFLSNCTFVIKPEGKYDENNIKNKPITLDSILSDPKKYGVYDSRYTDILKEHYFESKAIARQEYIKVVLKAQELGIRKSPYLDTCCNHIIKIDSLLNENSMIKYCDTIKKGM